MCGECWVLASAKMFELGRAGEQIWSPNLRSQEAGYPALQDKRILEQRAKASTTSAHSQRLGIFLVSEQSQ